MNKHHVLTHLWRISICVWLH